VRIATFLEFRRFASRWLSAAGDIYNCLAETVAECFPALIWRKTGQKYPSLLTSPTGFSFKAGADEVPFESFAEYLSLSGKGSQNRTFSLIVMPSLLHRRVLSAYKLPSSVLAEMARMDLAIATPFSDRSAAVLVPRFTISVSDSAYYIIRQSDLTKVRDTLKSAQIGISELRVRHPSGDLSIVNASELNLPRSPWSTRLWSERRIVLAALAAVLLVLSYLTFATRLSAAVSDTERHLVSLEEQAKGARTRIDTAHSRLRTLSSLRTRSISNGSIMLTIADLTHILPDGTFLTDIEIAEAAVKIAGYSNSASALIGLLQDSGRFSNVRFSSSVTRAVGYDGERFSISMERAHAG